MTKNERGDLCPYSYDSQREELIEGQLRKCTDYTERNGMIIIGSYIDRALSAKTAGRPEFQHMIKDSAKGLFEIVLVWKLDRFSCDRYDSADCKHILKKNSVKVCLPKSIFPTDRRVSFSNPCWKDMPSFTPQNCPRKSIESKRKIRSKARIFPADHETVLR